MARPEENSAIGQALRETFPVMSLRVMGGNCPFCAKPVNPLNPNEFKDAISRKEFGISGLCQACQDEFFGKD